MNFGTLLYNLILMPLQLIFDFVFTVLLRIFDKPIFSLIGLSLVVNLLCLPLYKRADAIQMAENEKQKSMSRWVDHIKKTFKGDERYMMLNTYYRQQNYKPIYTIKSSISLLLQIPFFMVAYSYLSNLESLKGVSFWIFNDLGSPDRLFMVGSFTVNILPILMTLLNVISAYIYLRGMPLAQKIQTYALALIFLVILYNSPSGLVIYWTCNQIFSLLKNVFMKLVTNRKVLGICVSVVGIIVALYMWLSGRIVSNKRLAVVILIFIICQIPLVLAMKGENRHTGSKKNRPVKYRVFLLGGIFLTVLLGCVIPLSVISSSPTEFNVGSTTPLSIVINNVCIYAGFFLIWFNVFYLLGNESAKRILSYILLAVSWIAAIDFLFVGNDLGTVSTYLVFDSGIHYAISDKILNIILAAAVAAVMFFVHKYLSKYIQYAYLIMIAGAVGLVITNAVTVNTVLTEAAAVDAEENGENIITLSRNGKNVIIFEMDRAKSVFIPYILQERPELKEIFEGFVYYPNTVSFGWFTNYAVPAVYGGYEYTPWESNKRDDESLQDKHNEALLLMPTLFSDNGYKVTIIDPPYAGDYKWTTNISIYDDMENVNAFVTSSKYSEGVVADYNQYSSEKRTRNFFYYSLLKTIPSLLQNSVYDKGNYYRNSEDNSINANEEFLKSYGVLCSLDDITEIEDSDENCMVMMNNNIAHAPTILDTDTYEPSVLKDYDIYADNDRFVLENGKYLVMDDETDIASYDSNMAGILKLADYIKYLKDEGIYDNCRIIIVSDHASWLEEDPDLMYSEDLDAEALNPVLMVKDFGAEGELETSDEFMTNADVPTIAMTDLIENPVNPSTGNEVNNDAKYEDTLYVTTATIWDVDYNRGNVFDTSDGKWFTVKDDIYVESNWELYEETDNNEGEE